MEAKVKKFFSEIFVNTYDYPFIIGFLEANGIDGIVPSLNKEGTKTCVNYEMFKNWWKQNFAQKHPKDADERVNEDKNGIRSEANPRNGKIEHIDVLGDKSYAINIAEVLDDFVKYNTEQAERSIFVQPHFKDFRYFILKHIIPDILDR